jgi:hypothetical protein
MEAVHIWGNNVNDSIEKIKLECDSLILWDGLVKVYRPGIK